MCFVRLGIVRLTGVFFSCTNRLKLKDGGLVWIFGVYGKRNVVLKKYKNGELTMTLPWVGFILEDFFLLSSFFPCFLKEWLCTVEDANHRS